MMLDIRRNPEKVEAAVKAVTPLVIKMGLPAGPPPPNTAVFIPCIWVVYENIRFRALYYPTFKEMVETFVKAGLHVLLFVEQI